MCPGHDTAIELMAALVTCTKSSLWIFWHELQKSHIVTLGCSHEAPPLKTEMLLQVIATGGRRTILVRGRVLWLLEDCLCSSGWLHTHACVDNNNWK